MSIQFATSFIESGPGITSENDASAAITAVSVDVAANSLTVTFRYGTVTVVNSKTTSFAVDPTGPGGNITFLMNTNTFQTSNGISGTLTAGEISAVNGLITAAMTAVRDLGESFAFNHNVFGAGATNVPW